MGRSQSRFDQLKSTVDKLNHWAMALGMGWVLVMMFLTTMDVVGRYFFSTPVPGAIEMSEFMLAIFGLAGIAYTQGQGANVRVTMLTGKLPARMASFLNLITSLFSLQVVIMLVWYGIVMALEEYHNGTTTDTLGIPIYPLHFLLSLGAGFLSLEILLNFVEAVLGVFGIHHSDCAEETP